MDTDVDRALDFYLTRNQAFSQPPSIEPHDHTTSARKVGSPRARGPGVWWWRRLRRRAARLTIPDDDGAQRRHVPPFARTLLVTRGNAAWVSSSRGEREIFLEPRAGPCAPGPPAHVSRSITLGNARPGPARRW
jgi:hypothetical protein